MEDNSLGYDDILRLGNRVEEWRKMNRSSVGAITEYYSPNIEGYEGRVGDISVIILKSWHTVPQHGPCYRILIMEEEFNLGETVDERLGSIKGLYESVVSLRNEKRERALVHARELLK